MTRAIVPTQMPELPADAVRWRRSLRQGSMYHALNYIGRAVCGSIMLDVNKSEGPRSLGDMQFWGVCPRCMAKVQH